VLPADRIDAFQRNLDAYDQPLTSWQPYTMKGGDNSSARAKHGIALSKLKPRERHQLAQRVGPASSCCCPSRIGRRRAAPARVFRPPVRSVRGKGGLVHVVKKGETLYGISRRYRRQNRQLLRWNHGRRPHHRPEAHHLSRAAKARSLSIGSRFRPLTVRRTPSHPCFPQAAIDGRQDRAGRRTSQVRSPHCFHM